MNQAPRATAIPGYRGINELDRWHAKRDTKRGGADGNRRAEAFQLSHRLALQVHELTHAADGDLHSDLADRLRTNASSIAINLMADPASNNPSNSEETIRTAHSCARAIFYLLLFLHDLGHISTVEYSRLRTDYLRVIQLLTRLIDGP